VLLEEAKQGFENVSEAVKGFERLEEKTPKTCLNLPLLQKNK